VFGDNKISAVLVSTDLEASQDFYQNKVGLTLSPETIKNHLVFDCGNGTSLLIYGRGSGNTADHTQVRFLVDRRGQGCGRAC
jgi:catechol 2,3-dioxygenase-like lactoylglutathione lyase family enzyme